MVEDIERGSRVQMDEYAMSAKWKSKTREGTVEKVDKIKKKAYVRWDEERMTTWVKLDKLKKV